MHATDYSGQISYGLIFCGKVNVPEAKLMPTFGTQGVEIA